MKIVFPAFLLFIGNFCFGQVKLNIELTKQSTLPVSSTIYYDATQRLQWSDFLGEPQERGPVAAVTFSGFGYKANIFTRAGKSELNIKVYCYFDKNKSWYKQAKASDYILSHEQHHFDISYIATCIFIDKIQGTVFTTANINETLSRLYNECMAAMNRMQDEYDSQTSNGRIKERQEEWDKKITSMLKQFTNPIKI